MNYRVPNSAANSSGPSVGASSMVTDANSVLSGGPHLQRSASFNTDSYLRLPASPMSFSSNNLSGSSVMDGGSMIQQSSQRDHTQRQSSATSHPASQDPGNFPHSSKKPRFDTRQDDMVHSQLIQQLLQRQDSIHLQGQTSPQMQALIQQKLLQQRHQQQILQSLPPMQRMQLLQQQQQLQQQQLRQQLPQQVMQHGPYIKRPYDSGICSRRLMQYLYHQRHRPPDNNILYWRKFVTEYFAPRAKMKWCLSSYDNAANQALGIFHQAAIDAWHCNVCCSKSGKGFEVTFEALPRLNKIKFDSGITDELLFVNMPNEQRLNTGIWLLEYPKVVQESVYEQHRVIREGQLRIIFTPELKILSWEFCARHHEEYLSRRLVAPQVNQMVQVAHKYQNAANEAGSSGMSSQDLQTNCNIFVSAGRQLAKNLELQSLNDLGFSKRYIRCLQIAEVVNSMKDLIDLTRDNKDIGPIEALKLYSQQAAAKLRDQKVQEAEHALPKASPVHTSQTIHANRSLVVPGILNNTPTNTFSLNGYQALLRQNSSLSALHRDANPGVSYPQLHGSVSSSPASLTNALVSGSSVTLQQQILNGNSSQHNNDQASQVSQHLQQHAIQQLLQEMMSNNRGPPQQLNTLPNMRGYAGKDTFGGVNRLPLRSTAASTGNELEFPNGSPILSNTSVLISNSCNNLKSVSNIPIVGSSDNYVLRQDLSESLHFLDIPDVAQEFPEWNI